MSETEGPGRSAVPAHAGLLAELERAKALGFLGRAPVQEHVHHALAYAEALGAEPQGPVADLGSGGGIPALPLALRWPGTAWTLVDRGDRRTAFLQDAVRRLGLQDRVLVRTVAGEQLAQEPEHRERYDVVTARSFGPLHQLAEISAGLLQSGGRLVVSEPPEPDPDRWPASSLARLGLAEPLITAVDGVRIAVVQKVAATASRYPRRRIGGWA